MKSGASKAELCLELDISHDTICRWQKTIPEFSEAIRQGEASSKAWWLKQGRENLKNPKGFHAVLWYMNMKNRHGWKDKQDVKLELPKPVIMERLNGTREAYGFTKELNYEPKEELEQEESIEAEYQVVDK